MAWKIVLGIPEDDHELLRALGRLAIAHGNLEMVQIMCLKTLENLRPHKALEEYRRKGADIIRKRIIDTVKKKTALSESHRKKDLTELLMDAKSQSKRRNALIHRFWGKDTTGHWRTSGDESEWENLPQIPVIDDLVASIIKTMRDLNKQRFKGGYLFDLANRSKEARTT